MDGRSRNSQQVVAAATQIEKLSVDLETGLRGYQLTGSRRFLEPWTAARARLPGQLARLRSLTAADPASRNAAAVIAGRLDAYVHEYAEPVIGGVGRAPMSHAAEVATAAEG